MTPERESIIRQLAADLETARAIYEMHAILNTPRSEPDRTVAMQEFALARTKMADAQRALDQAIFAGD